MLLIMDNSIDMVVCWFAINLLGAVEVPVNTANRGPSLVHVANNSGATVAIIDARHAAALVDVAGELTALRTAVVRGGVPDLPWATIGLPDLDASPGAPPEVEVTYRDPASIIYTSGTTGPAKGVVVPHGHMHTFAAHVVEQLRIGEDDVLHLPADVSRQRAVHAGAAVSDDRRRSRVGRRLQRQSLARGPARVGRDGHQSAGRHGAVRVQPTGDAA